MLKKLVEWRSVGETEVYTWRKPAPVPLCVPLQVLSGIRAQNTRVRASEDGSCLRPRGQCDRHIQGNDRVIYLKDLRKTMKYFSRINHCLCWQSNRTHFEYMWQTFPLKPNCLVTVHCHRRCVDGNCSVSIETRLYWSRNTNRRLTAFSCAGNFIWETRDKRELRRLTACHVMLGVLSASQWRDVWKTLPSTLYLCYNGVGPWQTGEINAGRNGIRPSLTEHSFAQNL
jgi:hypothetical protein